MFALILTVSASNLSKAAHSLGCTNLQPSPLSPPDSRCLLLQGDQGVLGMMSHLLAEEARSPWIVMLHTDPMAPHGRDCLALHQIHFFFFNLGNIVGLHLLTCLQ